MSISIIDDPDHWRERAEDARNVAEQLSDPVSRDMMLRIAESCDRTRRACRVPGEEECVIKCNSLPVGCVSCMTNGHGTVTAPAAAASPACQARRATYRTGTNREGGPAGFRWRDLDEE
jgi:hypothetical protein